LQRRAATPAELGRDVRREQPELDRPLVMTLLQLGRDLAVRQLDLDLVGDELVGKGPGGRLDREVVLGQSVHRLSLWRGY
jgi:hypothetical protein